MRLNLPIDFHDRTILLAGAGGGWDVFGALPLAHELEQRNCRVVMANYSSSLGGFDVRPALPQDHPEGKLAAAVGKPVYIFGKEGARTLRAGYQRLIQDQGIDAIILVDGGVDSLMRGDEEGPGTIIQDAVSLSVVNSLDVPTKILACIGFGAEADEDVCHYRALENMAALAGDGSFLGACALTQAMECFQHYKTICEAIFEQGGDISHIHTRVIPAVDGEFGQFQRYRHAAIMLLSPRPPFLSPLMSVFWFFDVAGVAARSLLAEPFAATETYADVRAVYDQLRDSLEASLRPNKDIPL
jgi:hypothetical protein